MVTLKICYLWIAFSICNFLIYRQKRTLSTIHLCFFPVLFYFLFIFTERQKTRSDFTSCLLILQECSAFTGIHFTEAVGLSIFFFFALDLNLWESFRNIIFSASKIIRRFKTGGNIFPGKTSLIFWVYFFLYFSAALWLFLQSDLPFEDLSVWTRKVP